MERYDSFKGPFLFSSLVTAFDTEFFISGLAPLADQLVVLYFVKNSDHMVVILFLH